MSGNIQLKMSKDYSVQFIVEDIQTVKWSGSGLGIQIVGIEKVGTLSGKLETTGSLGSLETNMQ